MAGQKCMKKEYSELITSSSTTTQPQKSKLSSTSSALYWLLGLLAQEVVHVFDSLARFVS